MTAPQNDMDQKKHDQDGIHALWPTHFMQQLLPNAQGANDALLALILEQEDQHRSKSKTADITSDYLSQEFLTIEHPVIVWLKGCINKSIVDYLKNGGLNYGIDWALQAWPNINRRGDYHNVHNHPHSYLSGTYYVTVPAQYDKTIREDTNPGAISFYDPRAQANMLSIRGDAQVEAEHRVLPTAGMLLLWPSFLHHFVHPNLSDELRISVSFNVLLKWRDDYVP